MSEHLQQAGYGSGAAAAGGQPPAAAPVRRRRKPLVIGLIAGVVVLAVVGLVLTLTNFGGGGGGSDSAGDVVKGYLEALARGDADAALSYSDNQPGTKDLLTDAILKKQIDEWPITDIRILDDDSSAAAIGLAQVHVTATFGSKTSDTTLRLKKNGDRWRLDAAAIKLDSLPGSSSNAAGETLTVFDKSTKDGSLYVFPGYLDIASTNEYLDVKAKDPLLLDKLSSYSTPWLQPDITLNDAGNEAIMDALKSDLAACRQSHSDSPPAPCPLKLTYDYAGSFVTWGAADISRVKIQNFSEYQLEATLYGELSMQVTTDEKSGQITPFISATADLSKSPLKLDYH